VPRGYFVEGLGAAQFALPERSTDARTGRRTGLRRRRAGPGDSEPDWPEPPPANATATRPDRSRQAVVLAAGDRPTLRGGAPLALPARGDRTSHRPGRKAGAVVVLVGGELVLYVERGGKTLLSWTDDPVLLQPSAQALAAAVRDGALGG